MDELISRQAAIEELSKYGSIWVEYLESMSKEEIARKTLIDAKHAILKILSDLPSVQPEQKKGKWIQINEKLGKCSCCGNIQTTNGRDRTGRSRILTAIYKYCPNCGARMGGTE